MSPTWRIARATLWSSASKSAAFRLARDLLICLHGYER